MGQAFCTSSDVTSVDELSNTELRRSAQTITALAVGVPEVAFRITVNTLSGDSVEFTFNQINTIQLTIADLKNEIATSAWKIPYTCQKLTSVDPSVVGILQDDDCLTGRHYLLVISLEMLNPDSCDRTDSRFLTTCPVAGALWRSQAITVLQDLEQLGPSGMKSMHAATMAALSQCLDGMPSSADLQPARTNERMLHSLLNLRSPLTEADIGFRNMLFYESICPQVMRVFVQFADKGDQHAVDTLCSLACHPRTHICSLALSLIPEVAEKGDQHAVGAATKCLLSPVSTNAYQLAAVQAITQLAEKGDKDAAAAVAKCYYNWHMSWRLRWTHWVKRHHTCRHTVIGSWHMSDASDARKDRSGVDFGTVRLALEATLDALGETTSAAVEERLDYIAGSLPHTAGTETYDQIRDLVRLTMQSLEATASSELDEQCLSLSELQALA